MNQPEIDRNLFRIQTEMLGDGQELRQSLSGPTIATNHADVSSSAAEVIFTSLFSKAPPFGRCFPTVHRFIDSSSLP